MQDLYLESTDEFPIGQQSAAFYRRFFLDSQPEEWGDWKWQMQHALRTPDDFSRVFNLSKDETAALNQPAGAFPTRVTPYYASLLDRDDANDPLRKTMLPSTEEFASNPGEYMDPLAEDVHSPVPGLVHRYPDRALFLIAEHCSVYCRYCTRSRRVGVTADPPAGKARWELALDYLRKTPSVRDVLISGGDPLIYPEDKLDWLLGEIRHIPHVEMIRIGTKVPLSLPQRITPNLCRILKRHHPLYISLHAMHPNELTPEATLACNRLANAGITMRSQVVLLKGVNDSVETMKKLNHGLLKIRVSPYYLLQCDPIQGSAHLRTPVSKGIEIIKGLRGHTSGYAVPHFIVDTPNGGGKISLDPEYISGRDGDDLLITNYQDVPGFRYHDPE